MPSPATLTVDLNALAANFHTLEAVGGAPVNPVVKADSYGLGAVACATRLMAEGARTFFVARTAEGEVLRGALGPDPVLYVLDGCVRGTAQRLIAADLRPVLNTLACSDDPAEPMNRRQRDAFAAATQRYPGVTRSFANSGGVFLGRDYAFDALRPGICLYGGGPEGRPDSRIRAVATLEAEVLQVRAVPAGETVGYSRGFHAKAPTRIATCAAGYADGLLRAYSPHGQVFIAGALRPIVGRVSMDVCAVDIGDLEVSVGDRIELYGGHRMLDDAATAAGTISYELLTSVTARVPRLYIG
ncbi:MAG: alanine racemase [Brevundimonas sp.]|nr:MAG: alanine racemase [Brevundimonas sp.]